MLQNQTTNTILTEVIQRASGEKLLDKSCKLVLANKQILAHIMKECVPEYQNASIEDIAEFYIEGTPHVGSINILTGENIVGSSTEDLNMQNGKTFYDIRYRAVVPNDDDFIELILNIEIQNDYYPGYPLIKRAINYASNMIANQYGTEFVNSDYAKIKKVYSIWICHDVPKRLKNSMNSYQLTEKQRFGNASELQTNYDLLEVVMIYLGQAGSKTESNVLKLLNTLLCSKIHSKEKIEFLEQEFNISRSKKLESEVSLMCNLSIGVRRSGIQQGNSEKAIEIAKSLLQSKMVPELVAKHVKLTINEIKSLQAEISA